MWIEKFQIKKTNAIAALYPTAKMWMTLFYVLGTFIISTIKINGLPLLLIPWFGILVILSFASGISVGFYKAIRKAFVLALIIFLVQTFIVPGGDVLVRFGFFRIYEVGLRTGTNLSLMILNIAGIFVWLFQTTEHKEISRAMEEAGIHYKASFIFLSTMQMIEILTRNSKVIMNAQKARGVETEGNIFIRAKAFIPSLIPLVLGAIINNEDRVLTLESKGFDVQGPKTHLLKLNRTGNERKAVVLSAMVLIVLIVGRIILWIK